MEGLDQQGTDSLEQQIEDSSSAPVDDISPISRRDTSESAEEEQGLGSSPRHRQVSALMTEIAKVARSFILYDPRNEAIHHFLSSLLNNLIETLRVGPVRLAVQPFELWYEGEVVYLNRDREKSLSFRFYRDGVRGIAIEQGFDWDELTRFLEILSIRYTGVHQHEDDVVTLLWKANFAHLEVRAVEGYVPEDEEEEEEALTSYRFQKGEQHESSSSAESDRSLPDNVDLPAPTFQTRASPVYEALDERVLEEMRHEVSVQALPDDCLRLMTHVHRCMNSRLEMWTFHETSHLFNEIREFLLSDEHLEPLSRFYDFIKKMTTEEPPPWDPTRKAAFGEFLKGFGDERAVRKLIHSLPVDTRELRPEMLELFVRVCPDPFMEVMNTLGVEHGQAARAVGRDILTALGKDRLDALEGRFLSVKGAQARDLLRVIARIGGERAAMFVSQQCSHPDTEIQDEAIRQIENMPYNGQVGKSIFNAFRIADPSRRSRLLTIMEKTRDRRFVDTLARWLEQPSTQLPSSEAQEIGRFLGRLGGERYFARWKEWLEPRGFLKKVLGGTFLQQVAGVSALGELPLLEAEATLSSASKFAPPGVMPFIDEALERFRITSGRQ